MTSHIEQLPFELLLIIFSYLEAHDLVNAFGNLNSYFRSLLTSPQLRVHVNIIRTDVHNQASRSVPPLEDTDSLTTRTLRRNRLVKFLRRNVSRLVHLNSCFRSPLVSSQIRVHTNINQVPSTSIWSVLPLESIDSLTTQILRPNRLVEFLRQNMLRLVHLTSLKLEIENKDVEQVAFILPHLVSLKRLSINELSQNPDDTNQSVLLFAIFRMPNLKVCTWSPYYLGPLFMNTIGQENQPINTSIEQMYINKNVTTSFVLFLLHHLPHLRILRLQYLDWSESTSYSQESLHTSLVVLAIGTVITSLVDLERLIRTIPHLCCLHVTDWYMRSSEDEAALFDGHLKQLFDTIACVHVGTVLEVSIDQRDEMYLRITSCSWLTMKKESYDYMDGCVYFYIVFKRFNRVVCRQHHSKNQLNIDYSLRRLGFRTDYAI
jgi:hypothetical protein